MSGLLDTVLAVVAEPAVHALLHFLWQGSLVAIGLGVALVVLRRRSAETRYRWACWSLALMVALPLITAGRHLLQAPRFDARPAATEIAGAEPAAPVDTGATIREQARTIEETPVTSRIAGTLLRQLSWDPGRSDTAYKVLGIWLVGVLLLSATHLGGWFRVRRLRDTHIRPVPEAWEACAARLCEQLGIGRTVRVLRSAATEVPLVIGWLKPVVLIPAGAISDLPLQQLECILAHELAHVWRRDYLVNLLQVVAETLLFYHPAVWWVSRQIRVERENCCDDIAAGLAGDRLVYARALVDLEDLRRSTPRLALGAGDGSLLRRIKRLVGGPEMSTHSNRSLMAGTLAALGVLVGGAVLALAAQHRIGEALAQATGATAEQAAVSGYWAAEREDDRMYVEIHERGDRSSRRHGRWNMSFRADVDDFTDLAFTEDAAFRLTREAGVMAFTGDFEGTDGDGRFTFTADEGYVSRLADLGTRGLDGHELLVLATNDLRTKTVDKLIKKGYGPFDDDELVTIAIFDVTPDYIDDMGKLGYEDIDLDDLVAMRVHGVSRETVEELRDAGLKTMRVDDLIGWRVHGIDGDYVKEMRETFGDDMSPGDIMSFRIHGVDGDYAERIATAGYGSLDADDLLSWKIHGIDDDYIEEIRETFGRGLSPNDILSFRIHGVDGTYAERIAEAGYGSLDADDLLSWKIHGIDKHVIEDIHETFGEDMDADDILSLRIHRVDGAYARRIAEAGYDGMDAGDLLSWKIHGVSPGYIQDLAELGYEDIDADDLLSMKIHGAGPSWIRRLHKRGLDDLSVDDLIRLRISGVEF